jgi:hypothetical protein
MSFTSIRQALTAAVVAVLVSACGGSGSSAPPPTGGITVTPGDGTATVTWTATPGVKYWLFYAPSSTISSVDWINIPGSRAILDVTSPYVLTGLANGYTYSFTVNGRNGDGQGDRALQRYPSSRVPPAQPGQAAVPWGQYLAQHRIRHQHGGCTGVLRQFWRRRQHLSQYQRNHLECNSPAASTQLNAAAYTLSKFIAVGDGGKIVYGTDLAAWSTANANTTENLNAIASSGAMAVAVGNNGTLRASADGVTWTVVASPTTQNLYGVAYAGSGIWTAVGAKGTLLTSSDGLNWSLVASGTTADLRAVAVQATTLYTFLATGNGGAIVRSTDNGVTWAAQTSGTTADLLAVSSTYSQFLVTGSGGAVLTSPSGITWTTRTSGTSANLLAVLSGFAQYVAVGQNGVNINSQ